MKTIKLNIRFIILLGRITDKEHFTNVDNKWYIYNIVPKLQETSIENIIEILKDKV